MPAVPVSKNSRGVEQEYRACLRLGYERDINNNTSTWTGFLRMGVTSWTQHVPKKGHLKYVKEKGRRYHHLSI